MNTVSLSAFFDELEKIASSASEAANRAIGLPLKKPNGRAEDKGSESRAEFKSHAMLYGDQAPNYTMADITTSPSQNPGGV